MRVRDDNKTGVFLSASINSNSWIVKMPILVDGLYQKIVLSYEINIGGVTFDDGSLIKTIQVPKDISLYGEQTVYFYKASKSGSNCHRLTIWANNQKIAHIQ